MDNAVLNVPQNIVQFVARIDHAVCIGKVTRPLFDFWKFR